MSKEILLEQFSEKLQEIISVQQDIHQLHLDKAEKLSSYAIRVWITNLEWEIIKEKRKLEHVIKGYEEKQKLVDQLEGVE